MKSFLENLAKENLFLCDYDIENDKMCLKNEKDEVIFMFTIQKDMNTINSIRYALRSLNHKIENSRD